MAFPFGHVSFATISLLNKLGYASVTSLLISPFICLPYQLVKSQLLPFKSNDKHALHILDLVYCDLWGQSPVVSIDGYHYYAIFMDNHSRLTWFYFM